MRSRASVVLVLAVCLGGSVVAGCGSSLPPRSLTAAQASVVKGFGSLGVGWLPAVMNVLPGWSLSEPEQSRNFDRRLAYSIASADPHFSRRKTCEDWSRCCCLR
ncbi:MAG: hypothetical protein JF614_20330 [Acidobacteria bacterium]|nr:hypothetical protein [Acidobacteriota bacterium]